MGTVLFIVLRLVNLINTPVDYPILCGLISLDTIGLPTLWKVIKK